MGGIFGVSVGALNGALVAQLEYDRLLHVWQTIRQQDVYRKVWWPWLAVRLVILSKPGIYDNTALRDTIQQHVAGRPFRVPLHVGRVSLVSGAYESVRSDMPKELIVVNCSPDQPDIDPRPGDILAAARRSLADITINEIMVDDVREFIRINKLVKQAKKKGITLERDDGKPYLDCTIGVFTAARAAGRQPRLFAASN